MSSNVFSLLVLVAIVGKINTEAKKLNQVL